MELVVLETARTQDYIFRSNRLRHNLAASYLVAQALGSWARNALPTPNNVKETDDDDAPLSLVPMPPDAKAEVIYASSGTLLVLFDHPADARAFLEEISRHLLNHADGLQVVYHRRTVEPASNHASLDENIEDAIKAARTALAIDKLALPAPPALLAPPLARRGAITDLPAVAVEKPAQDADQGDRPYPVAKPIQQQRAALHQANQRLEHLLPIPPLDGVRFSYPVQFSELGGSPGETNFTAVVHADGDDIGTQLHNLEPDDHPSYSEALRVFSSTIRDAALGALRTTIRDLAYWLAAHLDPSTGQVRPPHATSPSLILRLSRDAANKTWRFPIRPIVFGGDDVTLVCDGRLGLAVAARYLEHFYRLANAKPHAPPFTSSAGVAITHTAYPFNRAHDLAGELTASAKAFRKTKGYVNAIDWHIAYASLAPLATLREQGYRTTSPSGHPVQLFNRPLAVSPQTHARVKDYEHLAYLEELIGALRQKPLARNKLKTLRTVLAEGSAAVSHFTQRYAELPTTEATASYQSAAASGSIGTMTPYFDALELLDVALFPFSLDAASQEAATPSNTNA